MLELVLVLVSALVSVSALVLVLVSDRRYHTLESGTIRSSCAS